MNDLIVRKVENGYMVCERSGNKVWIANLNYDIATIVSDYYKAKSEVLNEGSDL